ncbi:MAG: hypothetical protein MRJ65_10315 [Candidatus Brocadiaceae bacterium]|nr:hypothetical protein [Candidatus Brocadiaceae bacterium]
MQIKQKEKTKRAYEKPMISSEKIDLSGLNSSNDAPNKDQSPICIAHEEIQRLYGGRKVQ